MIILAEPADLPSEFRWNNVIYAFYVRSDRSITIKLYDDGLDRYNIASISLLGDAHHRLATAARKADAEYTMFPISIDVTQQILDKLEPHTITPFE